MVPVDVLLDGYLPKGAIPDLSVDVRMILGHFVDIVKVARPMYKQL